MNLSKLYVRGLNMLFGWLYSPLAWAYDFIADMVSLGRWRKWIRAIIPMLDCSPILELGFGPGHLLAALASKWQAVFGVDSSRQMSRIAQRRLVNAGLTPQLVRAMGQGLPFPNQTFACLVATFPAPYLFTPETAAEASRVLVPGGKLVVLLSAQFQGAAFPEKIMRIIFRQTGQQPTDEAIADHLLPVFHNAGFGSSIHREGCGSDELLVVVMHNNAATSTAL